MAAYEIVAGGHLVTSAAAKSTAYPYFSAVVGEVKKLAGFVFFASLGYAHAHHCCVDYLTLGAARES